MAASNDEYTACLKRLYRLRRFGIKLGLDVIGGLLAHLGNPHHHYHCIHVAGTNGKGSVAADLATLLTTAGYRTGLYTSPHLVRFNERIAVDGRPIEDREVTAAYDAVRAAPMQEREPTFFEFATAMALYTFRRRKVQWAVVETGMGGRLDATNIIRPQVSIITNISLEHRAYLGATLAAIAGEKAGIIKDRVPVVTGVTQPSAMAAIRKSAEARQAPLLRLGTDFRIRRRPDGRFDYAGLRHRWQRLALSLSGPHQCTNAALALAACEAIEPLAPHVVDAEVVRRALQSTRWPGRLEIVRRHPTVILDGAHNLAAARNLGRYLAGQDQGRPITLVVGILDDKPFRPMLRALLPYCHRVICTRPRIDRALPAEQLADEARAQGAAVMIRPTVAEAVKTAIAMAAHEEIVCVAGSLYVVGEAKEILDTPSDMV
ncbi:MAG TPA: bifunctional folylpolyglutamate synthase/dihydrofolate synthase [Desulfobacteraceae bacterium]|nr:bifunctional folylpolyglutamate synthase/dihydrofolate synthase [Deltaproteobacteria bacterium]RLB99279.1 MAG: bifunctional folylpolyglutamate synthase/dihydrofolate synthase [Deltaproteobacteria bacterium]HDI59254.1 bifunctional folylpolyglutamate synthase/dihydrofolate synthase [Desulfobacteraceae bacterium]